MKIIGANITGSFILNGQDVTNTLQSSSIWSGSVASSIVSLNNATFSFSSSISSLNVATSSLNSSIATYTTTASFNSYTSSNDSAVLSATMAAVAVAASAAALTAKTSSYATTGSNAFVGNQTISGSLIPAVNIAYDLGSSSNRWKDLYLSGSTIYLGEAILSATTGGIQIKDVSGSYQSIIGSSLQISGGAALTMDTASGMIKMLNTGTSSLHMPVEFSGSFSGSFFGTSSLSSQSISASYSSNALTASYANNASTASYLSNYIPPFPYTGSADISGSLTVTGNITAQTLIVQTITSSQDFITGSTRFGSISANTHQFTGPVSITGSLNVKIQFYLTKLLQWL